MIRSAMRELLRESPEDLVEQLRSLLKKEDDYTTAGKPSCDWDDTEAREALIDALTRDAKALLDGVGGQALGEGVSQAATLLAWLRWLQGSHQHRPGFGNHHRYEGDPRQYGRRCRRPRPPRRGTISNPVYAAYPREPPMRSRTHSCPQLTIGKRPCRGRKGRTRRPGRGRRSRLAIPITHRHKSLGYCRCIADGRFRARCRW